MPRIPFFLQLLLVGAAAFALMWLSTPQPRKEYDYTRRIAVSLMNGQLGPKAQPPQWLNEMVPFNGRYYSVFPLGSVLCVMPFAWLEAEKIVRPFPLRFLISLIASGIAMFAFALAGRYPIPFWKKCLFATAPIFGSCLWANLSFGGAWQIAIGLSVLGEIGALYFCTGKQRPFLAGLFFAIAFGNRTEVLLTAPLFYFLLLRGKPQRPLLRFALFSIVPGLLGVATLAYNHARFGSPMDFGYARIPGVLDEPWYRDGIFSLTAIPRNAKAMLLESFKILPKYPYIVPTGWGGSLLLYSPFLILLLFRIRRGDLTLRTVAWIAIIVLTFLLWIHGNPGGWQVSYRYASTLYPWALLLLLEGEPRNRIGWAPAMILAAIAINGCATWIFCETKYMTP